MIIVIDGPAGSGKSSTAEAVAGRLNIQYLDSGALYRAVTVVWLEAGKEKELFFESLKKHNISFEYSGSVFHVYLDGKDITVRIREPEISAAVSDVAAMPDVRSFVNGLMRKEARESDKTFIADGRDLGTAVFPDAALKFYMSAELDERARRRYLELKKEGRKVSLDQVLENIRKRDRKDSGRSFDPLKKAEDAIEINTTAMNFEQQVELICSTIESRINTNNDKPEP